MFSKQDRRKYLNNPDYSMALEKFHNEDYYDAFDYKKYYNIFCDKLLANGTVDQAYIFSNERLNEVFEDEGFKNAKSVLTVGGGDQVFSALYNGAKEITVADANLFVKYWIEYKKAIIKNFSYLEFKKLLFGDAGNLKPLYRPIQIFDKNTFQKIFHDLDEDSKCFWGSVFIEEYDADDIYNRILSRADCSIEDMGSHFYIHKDDYLKLQNILKQKDYEIEYKTAEFREFSGLSDKKYDLILLSNVCRYIHADKFKGIVERLYDKSLADGGTMQLYYSMQRRYIELYDLQKQFPDKVVEEQKINNTEHTNFLIRKPKIQTQNESIIEEVTM